MPGRAAPNNLMAAGASNGSAQGNDPNQNPFFDQTGTGYYGDPGYNDPNYNGYGQNYTGGEDQRFQRVSDYAAGLMNRQGPQLAVNGAGVENNAQDRTMQNRALDMQRQYAMGKGPSVAQAQAYGAMGQNAAAMNAASQNGNAAGAMRVGGGALNNAAMAGANARSNEQNGLMNAYAGGANAVRSGDVNQYGMDLTQGLRSQQLGQQQNILNAQTNLGFQGQEMQSELAAQNLQWGLYGQQLQQEQNDRNQLMGIGIAGANGASTVMSAGTTGSDRRMKTDVRPGMMGGY